MQCIFVANCNFVLAIDITNKLDQTPNKYYWYWKLFFLQTNKLLY